RIHSERHARQDLDCRVRPELRLGQHRRDDVLASGFLGIHLQRDRCKSVEPDAEEAAGLNGIDVYKQVRVLVLAQSELLDYSLEIELSVGHGPLSGDLVVPDPAYTKSQAGSPPDLGRSERRQIALDLPRLDLRV